MEAIIKQMTVYKSNDGKEFLNKEECEKYEKLLTNIKYFVVKSNPDLTETGLMQYSSVVAVYSGHYCHEAIVENWCVKEKGFSILMPSVQGYDFQRGFEIYEDKLNQWGRFKKGEKVNPNSGYTIPIYDEKIFLSPIEIEGFPKPFNYMEKWGFK